MTHSQNFYPAKILLFGEYSIIAGSRALATPLNTFGGFWEMGVVNSIDPTLQEWARFIRKLDGSSDWDMDKFEEDIHKGLAFKSSIPIGYGLGSSGALVAAFYDRYTINKSDNIDELKQILSVLESFFHGKSSGIDPLVSYIKQTISIDNQNNLVIIPGLPDVKSDIFMLDSGISRKTEPLVKHFQEKMTNSKFKNNLKHLIKAQEDAIDYWLQDDFIGLFNSFEAISRWQWENMSTFIPERHHEIWKKGLESGDYFLKLCGAGGGGATLGIWSRTHRLDAATKPWNPVFCFSKI